MKAYEDLHRMSWQFRPTTQSFWPTVKKRIPIFFLFIVGISVIAGIQEFIMPTQGSRIFLFFLGGVTSVLFLNACLYVVHRFREQSITYQIDQVGVRVNNTTYPWNEIIESTQSSITTHQGTILLSSSDTISDKRIEECLQWYRSHQ